MTRTAVAVLTALFTLTAVAQDQPAQQPPADWREKLLSRVNPKIWELLDFSKQLGNWDDHAAEVQYQIEDVFTRNGWTSEADQFAMETVIEAESVPPWDFMTRLNTLTSRYGERWGLDEPQQDQLQQIILNEGMNFFSQNSDTILAIANEAIQTRMSGEPFDAEKMRKLYDMATPLMKDAVGRYETGKGRVMEMMSPEQRELASVDLSAADRRVTTVQKMGSKWLSERSGEVQAAQKEIREAAKADAAARAAEAHGAAAPDAAELAATAATPAPVEPQLDAAAVQPRKGEAKAASDEPSDPWAQYVKEFIVRYDLSADQSQKAWQFYRQAQERAAILTKSTGKSGAKPTINERTQAQLDKTFEQMKARLEKLPTRAQRAAAKPAPTPDAKVAPKAKPANGASKKP